MRQLKLIPKLLTCCLLATLFSSHDVKADENIFSDANNLTSEDTLDKDTMLNLHNIFLACKAYWADNGGSNPCSVEIAEMNSYGYTQSINVLVTVTSGKESNFKATARHSSSNKTFRIDERGDVS